MAGSPQRVVLLGAGHAHLFTIKRTAALVRHGVAVSVIAPDTFWYSGLATGMLGGMYSPALDRVDVAALVRQGGGTFIEDEVMNIDVQARTVLLRSGRVEPYEALSLNLGSEVPVDLTPGAADHAWLVKPIRNLWRLRQELEKRFATAAADRPLQIVIMGGGATGCELAANIQRLIDMHDAAAQVVIVARSDRVPDHVSRFAAAAVMRSLRRRGIELHLDCTVTEVCSDRVRISDASEQRYDVLVDAVGLRPSPLIASIGLPTSDDGSLLVDEHLRSIADPRIFGGGDCIAIRDRQLAKIGVYAIREGPIIFENLLATLGGTPLRRFNPQRRYLLILNLGDGTGLATWGPLYWHGRAAFWLKDRIDRRFLAEYHDAGGRVNR